MEHDMVLPWGESEQLSRPCLDDALANAKDCRAGNDEIEFGLGVKMTWPSILRLVGPSLRARLPEHWKALVESSV
jgi:hypothetical protein